MSVSKRTPLLRAVLQNLLLSFKWLVQAHLVTVFLCALRSVLGFLVSNWLYVVLSAGYVLPAALFWGVLPTVVVQAFLCLGSFSALQKDSPEHLRICFFLYRGLLHHHHPWSTSRSILKRCLPLRACCRPSSRQWFHCCSCRWSTGYHSACTVYEIFSHVF